MSGPSFVIHMAAVSGCLTPRLDRYYPTIVLRYNQALALLTTRGEGERSLASEAVSLLLRKAWSLFFVRLDLKCQILDLRKLQNLLEIISLCVVSVLARVG